MNGVNTKNLKIFKQFKQCCNAKVTILRGQGENNDKT